MFTTNLSDKMFEKRESNGEKRYSYDLQEGEGFLCSFCRILLCISGLKVNNMYSMMCSTLSVA